MSRANTIGAVILGAAAGVALIKFFSMPEYERDEFISHLKNRAHELLDDAESTVDTVKQHFAEIDMKPKEAWVDKLFVAKRLLTELFGSEKRFLI
jgi:rhamnogalacturonyl hydrolase YesR